MSRHRVFNLPLAPTSRIDLNKKKRNELLALKSDVEKKKRRIYTDKIAPIYSQLDIRTKHSLTDKKVAELDNLLIQHHNEYAKLVVMIRDITTLLSQCS